MQGRASDAEAGGAAHSKHLRHTGHVRDVPSKRLVESLCILQDVRWTCMCQVVSVMEASGAVHLEHVVHAGHV